MVDMEKVKGKAEQLKGKVEQAVGKAVGSEETEARGQVHEAEGRAREKVADVKGKARGKIAEIKGEAISGMRSLESNATRLNLTSLAVAIVGAVILIAVFRALAPGRRRAV